jgi:uncharacterized sulfatase
MEYAHPIGPAAFDSLENKPRHQREWAEAVKGHSKYGVRHENEFMYHPIYFGCNHFVDHEIGRVLDAVEQYATENTYTIFTSDHGAMFWAHQLWSKGPAMYEEITHIPLIIKPPEKTTSEPINSTLVSHIDLFPTMLDLAGMEIPPILDGGSLVPMIHGIEYPDRSVFIEYHSFEVWLDYLGAFQPIRCIINGPHKLVLNQFYEDELYDLDSDPTELENLIENKSYSRMRDALHLQLLDWMDEVRDPFRGPAWANRSWRDTQQDSWNIKWRHRRADGYSPEIRDYSTGLPVDHS